MLAGYPVSWKQILLYMVGLDVRHLWMICQDIKMWHSTTPRARNIIRVIEYNHRYTSAMTWLYENQFCNKSSNRRTRTLFIYIDSIYDPYMWIHQYNVLDNKHICSFNCILVNTYKQDKHIPGSCQYPFTLNRHFQIIVHPLKKFFLSFI